MTTDPVTAAIESAVAKKKKRIAKLGELMSARHIARICAIQKEGYDLIHATPSAEYSKIAKKIAALAAEEKKLFELSQIQNRNFIKWFDEQISLRLEVKDLERDLADRRWNIR